MARSKRILWLAPIFSEFIEARSQDLQKHNFHCIWVSSLNKLSKELSEQRASIIIVSEGVIWEQSQDCILGLGTIVEAKGSRWIFISKSQNETLSWVAMASNFRDVVPEDIPNNLWLYRVLYASSGQAMNFPIPNAQITLDHPAHLHFPGRIIWINSVNIRVESQMAPPIGAKITLNGPLFEQFGDPIILEVKSNSKTRLTYRFSGAIEGPWSCPAKVKTKILTDLSEKTGSTNRPKYRIFIAVKSKSLRQIVIDEFDQRNYDCNSALQLKSLIMEPRYFTPDLLIIEDKLCCGQAKSRFQEMLELIDTTVPILVIGDDSQIAELCQSFPKRRFVVISSRDLDSLGSRKESLLPNFERLSDMRKESSYLEADEPLSCISLKVPGKILSIHPLTAHISCPYPINLFSVFKIRSPFLSKWINKDPWMKVTQQNGKTTSHDIRDSHSVAGFFIDVTSQEKKILAQGLSAFINKVLGVNSPEGLKKKVNTNFFNEESQQQIDAKRVDGQDPQFFDPLNETFRNKQEVNSDSALTQVKEQSLPFKTPLNDDSLVKQIKRALSNKQFKRSLFFFLILFGSFLLIYGMNELLPRLIKNYQKPGTIYIEQLKKYNGTGGLPR